jgi:hypothetical protein
LDIHQLWRQAIISIESRDGRKQVWVHVKNQRFPLVNWADLEERLETVALNGNGISLLEEEGPRSRNN